MSGIVSIRSGDESSLLASLYSVGPISVRVDGRSNAFRVSDKVHTHAPPVIHYNLYHNALFTIQVLLWRGIRFFEVFKLSADKLNARNWIWHPQWQGLLAGQK